MIVRRSTRLLAVVLAAVLAPAGLSACSGDRDKHVSVGSQGGRVGPGGSLGQLDVPAGAVTGDTDVAFADGEPKTAGTLGGFAKPVGKAVSIAPAKPLPGAKVRLPFDNQITAIRQLFVP